MQRSVERVKGIKMFKFDLNKGQASLWFAPGSEVKDATIWQAVKKAGFTPVKYESKGKTYSGP